MGRWPHVKVGHEFESSGSSIGFVELANSFFRRWRRQRGARTPSQTARFSVQMTDEAPNNKNPGAHADLSVDCGAGAARTWALHRCSPGARGALSVLTVKSLCWGQTCNLVLFGSKKNDAIREFPQFATCGVGYFFSGLAIRSGLK
jgi:hypothetical protein